MLALGLVLAAGAVAGVVGAPNPTEPSGASVFNVGGDCAIKWDTDSTGSWKKMNIQLMTGDNWNMIHITTVGQDIDATDATKNTYSYTCPDVTPNSAIYFYQFSDPSDPKNVLWTTRWTLASADGKTTTPTETTQPNGDKIPWGKGALVDPSTAVPAPAYLTAGGSTNSSASAASSSPAVSTVTVVTQQSTAAAATTTPVVVATPTIKPVVTSTSSVARPAATGASTSASPSANSSNSTSAQTNANGATSTAISGFAMVGAFLAALGLF